jgi:hypothetical protein
MTFDPNEARDQSGRWTRGDTATGRDGEVERHLIDPRVVDVSGDEWNKKTAERLEREYAAVRPELDALANEGVEKGASVALGKSGDDDNEDDTPIVPEQWDALTGSEQEEAEQHYIDSHIDSEKDYVVQSWHDDLGGALYEAKHMLAKDDDFKSEWLSGYLSARDEDGDPRIPFKADDLLGAINIEAGDDDADPEITFDEKYLDKPDVLGSENQLSFPGIEPQKGSDFLTPKMREEIIKDLIAKFNEEAKSKAGDIEPPEYLSEEANTNVHEAWNGMDEDEQFNYAMKNVDSLSEQAAAAADAPLKSGDLTHLAWPAEFDPLNKTSGTDYQRTQALAKYIADRRGAQLITERVGNAKWKPRDQFPGSDDDYNKLYERPDSVGHKKDQAWTDRMMKELQSADSRLWSGWKGSSTNAEGRLLQVASADELGGRIRDAKQSVTSQLFSGEATVSDSKYKAKLILSDTGDYYLPELKAAAQKYMDENKFSVDEPNVSKVPQLKAEDVTVEGKNPFTLLPDVKIEKNGAASTTVSPTVANGWSGTANNAPEGINKKESIEYANKAYAAIGGYEGVKAAIRAKWETTQYLLDKADIPIVQAYRGINMPHKLIGVSSEGEFNPPISGLVKTSYAGEVDMTEIPVGASIHTASGKTITKTSEDNPSYYEAHGYKAGIGTWKFSQAVADTQSRIVLRTEVPRTAVVSIPAYGINVKSEQEVVVVGTGWKGWDAWSGRAPTFEEVPMRHKGAPAPEKQKAAA